MSVREYIGARYVPLFMGTWSEKTDYEPLSIVEYQGNSYTSRQSVPAGIPLTNSIYWAETGNYNAQIEAYRQEVLRFDDRITANSEELQNEIEQREIADNALNQRVSTIEAPYWVTTTRIANDAITTEKIADNAITRQKIAANAIGLRGLKGSNVVCIGDSYGRGVGGSNDQGWPYFFNQNSGIANILNVSNSGAGFIATGHSSGLEGLTFTTQIDYALNHLPAGVNAEDVNYVVIAGGYNDHAQTGQVVAARNTVLNAKSKFKNAEIHFFPLCTGDRKINNEYARNYIALSEGAAAGGAIVHLEALYWLYPFTTWGSYGDAIHPNANGYSYIGTLMKGVFNGGNMLAQTTSFASSAEGFAIADDATNINFRALVQGGHAFYGGAISRTGLGALCKLPTYCRPPQTTYFPIFVYADSTNKGICRLRITPAGDLNAYQMESGTMSNSLEMTAYIPPVTLPLGNIL